MSTYNKGNNDMVDNSCNNKLNTFNVTNSAPRCPVTLLVDTSGSMAGRPIEELNAAIQQFVEEMKQDKIASNSVDLEIISFNSSAQVVTPYTLIQDLNNVPTLSAEGDRSMGAGLSLAVNELNARRHIYKQNGCSSYKPMVILITAGNPTDNWQQAAAAMRELSEQNKIWYLGVKIGSNVDHDTMCQIMPLNSPPLQLDESHLRKFFKWLFEPFDINDSFQGDNEQVEAFSWADLADM